MTTPDLLDRWDGLIGDLRESCDYTETLLARLQGLSDVTTPPDDQRLG